jgi:hypothetical protein
VVQPGQSAWPRSRSSGIVAHHLILLGFQPVLQICDILRRIRSLDTYTGFRILLFSSETFKMLTKNKFFVYYRTFVGTFTAVFKDNNRVVVE